MPNIRVVDRPDITPFYAVTNNNSTDPSVDLGVDLEYHSGAVFITIDHGLAIGVALGMSEKHYVESLTAEIERLTAENNMLKGREDELVVRIRAAFDDYGNPDGDFLDPLAEGADPENEVPDAVSVEGNGTEGDKGPSSKSPAKGNGTAKSTSVKNADRVSADASGIDDIVKGIL